MTMPENVDRPLLNLIEISPEEWAGIVENVKTLPYITPAYFEKSVGYDATTSQALLSELQAQGHVSKVEEPGSGLFATNPESSERVSRLHRVAKAVARPAIEAAQYKAFQTKSIGRAIAFSGAREKRAGFKKADKEKAALITAWNPTTTHSIEIRGGAPLLHKSETVIEQRVREQVETRQRREEEARRRAAERATKQGSHEEDFKSRRPQPRRTSDIEINPGLSPEAQALQWSLQHIEGSWSKNGTGDVLPRLSIESLGTWLQGIEPHAPKEFIDATYERLQTLGVLGPDGKVVADRDTLRSILKDSFGVEPPVKASADNPTRPIPKTPEAQLATNPYTKLQTMSNEEFSHVSKGFSAIFSQVVGKSYSPDLGAKVDLEFRQLMSGALGVPVETISYDEALAAYTAAEKSRLETREYRDEVAKRQAEHRKAASVDSGTPGMRSSKIAGSKRELRRKI